MSPDKRKELGAGRAGRRRADDPSNWSQEKAEDLRPKSEGETVEQKRDNQPFLSNLQSEAGGLQPSSLDEDELPPAAERLQGKRIVCAECANCKMFKETNRQGCYILKVRCAKKHWYRGKVEVTLDLHLASLRHRDACPDYASTSDDEADRLRYIAELDDFLPIERHIYTPGGGFLDKTLTMKWGDGEMEK